MASDPAEKNLLSVLHKWARRQKENFLTDAFAHLLRQLQDGAPGLAADVLTKLIDPVRKFCINPNDVGQVTIKTQVRGEQGRPDIRISRGRDFLAYVEVKWESEVRPDQVQCYREELDGELESEGIANGSLVLLTRRPVDPVDNEGVADYEVRWLDVAKWLEYDAGALADDATRFLVHQFVDFLKIERITMQQVKRSLVEGVKSLVSLADMIREALGEIVGKKSGKIVW